jgi:hypothetical protein
MEMEEKRDMKKMNKDDFKNRGTEIEVLYHLQILSSSKKNTTNVL